MMFDQTGGGFCPWCGAGSTSTGETLLLLFFGALVIAGIVALIVWATTRAGHHDSPGVSQGTGKSDSDSALRIARERFARGEISQEEYEGIRRALEG